MGFRAIVVGIVFSTAALQGVARELPNFSGDYVLDKAASTLEGPMAAVQSGTLRIDHREPTFTFERTFIVNGMSFDASFTATTDGREQERTDQQNGSTGRSRLRWTGATLVLNVLISTPNGIVHNDVRYDLLENGRVLRAVEDVTGPAKHHNVWVYERR